MKKKDIITIVIALIVISVSVYFLISMIMPKPQAKINPETTTKTEAEFTGQIDEKTLEKVKQFNDYGEATLDNIGRANPFGPL